MVFEATASFEVSKQVFGLDRLKSRSSFLDFKVRFWIRFWEKFVRVFAHFLGLFRFDFRLLFAPDLG